ncbi:hypothetical protein P7K49_040191, partial [Saguinus oedipus]
KQDDAEHRGRFTDVRRRQAGRRRTQGQIHRHSTGADSQTCGVDRQDNAEHR